jgi:hypothetical protein
MRLRQDAQLRQPFQHADGIFFFQDQIQLMADTLGRQAVDQQMGLRDERQRLRSDLEPITLFITNRTK